MTLLLFFTRAVSLEIWLKQGLFDREKLIYEEHLKQGNLKKVYWITYGSHDLKLSNQLKQDKRLNPNIVVIGMPKLFNFPKIGSYIYSLLIPFLYPNFFRDTDIFKSNQMDGAWSGVIAKWLYRKPLLVRTGYSISQLLCDKNPSTLKCKWFKFIEKYTYKYGDLAIVSSNHNCEYIMEKYGISNQKILVQYNYINLDVFKPKNEINKYSDRILYVGRLNPEKNLFSLVQAISDINFILDIYGEGDQIENKLKGFALKNNVKVNFFGVVSNDQLPKIYNQYNYYILPSYHEGMPKTLIEAMASGCLCIGTDVPGINEIISDGVNGILSRTTTSEGISKALKRAINTDNKEILIKNGVSMVNERCALGPIAQKEFSIFRDLVDAKL
jgi:glycosyltransferase involved in cell wall biosynthesis